MSQAMIVETHITWMPVREVNPDKLEFKAVLQIQRRFQLRPATGEQVLIEGEFFPVTHFFHDTDNDRIQVCLRPEFRHSEAEAQARVVQLEQKGWVRV